MTRNGLALLAGASGAVLSVTPSALGAAPASLETIVITAERIRDEIEQQRQLTPGAVTLVDGADFYRRSVNNVADMLRYVP